MNRSASGPGAMQIARDIVPLGELKAHLSQLLRQLRGGGRPLVVTQNGKAAAVLLSPEEFDRLTAQARFVAAVREGLEEAEAGRVVDHATLGRLLDERFARPTAG